MVLRGMALDWSELEGEEAAGAQSSRVLIGLGVVFWKALLLEIQAVWLEMETLMYLCFQGPLSKAPWEQVEP